MLAGEDEDFLPNGPSETLLGNGTQRAREEIVEKEILESRQRSEELQAFIEDQVAQVFQSYLRDYFQKEISLLRLVIGLMSS